MSEADSGAAGEDELAAFRRAGHTLVRVAGHLAASVAAGLAAAPRRPARGAARATVAGSSGRAGRPRRDDDGRCAAARHGQRPPRPSSAGSFRRLARRRRRLDGGIHPTSSPAPRGPPRTGGRALAGRARRFPAEPAPACSPAAHPPRRSSARGRPRRALAPAGHDSVARSPPAAARRHVPAEAHSSVRRALGLLGLGSVPCATYRSTAAGSRGRAAGSDRRRSRRRGASGAARRLGRHGQLRRDDPLTAGRERRARILVHVDGRTGVRRARPGDRDALSRHGAGRLAGSTPTVARVPVDAGCALVIAATTSRRVQPDPAVPPPGHRAAGRSPSTGSTDATIPRAEDVGDHRRARTRRSPRGDARERARARAATLSSEPDCSCRRGEDLLSRSGGRPAVRPPGWTRSTGHCPTRFRRAAAPSSPAPSSAAASATRLHPAPRPVVALETPSRKSSRRPAPGAAG